ncbi:hypothetical protein [Pseudomonas saliphila]|uniref:hypothetical protein n=1 Tax=Pseudomonas saliphila TaxID=2586906 RepID=UPI00123955F2|nr:hypothetical protein [Pseudomonas saliphila]
MSLHIAFVQRTPLILAAALGVLLLGQSSMDHQVPSAGTWERAATLEFGSVRFAEAQAQPMSLSQRTDVQAATLPTVSQLPAVSQMASETATPRWVF